MANLQDYVRWRGDITLAERPFNDVDNLVLSALAYLDLDGVVPEPGHGHVTVAAAAQRMQARDPRPDEVTHRLNFVDESLLADVAVADRYRTAFLSNYVDVIDTATGMQFSAVAVELDDNSAYVAFRGTDNTMMGWREDLTMSFQVMPAQTFAAGYLTDISRRLDRPLRVGGHSKGGNLAVYSAMKLPAKNQDSIIAVYSNDGPGLSLDVQEPAGLQPIDDRIIRIVPQFAVIGMLFETEPHVRVVASTARGLLQHDLMTWQVQGNDLCEVPHVASRASAVNAAFDSWLEEATMEDRRTFTDALFGALTAGGATLTTHIGHVKFGSFESVIFTLGRTRRTTRRPVGLAVRVAARTVAAVDYRALWRDRRSIRLAGLIAVGVLFMVVPDLAVQVLGSFAVFLLALWGTVRFSRYLARFRTKHQITWRFVAVQAAVLLALLFAISRIDVLILPTNVLLGLAFLANAWSNGKRSLEQRHQTPLRRAGPTWLLIIALVSMLFGIVALSTAGRVMPFFILQAGAYFVVSGMVGLFLYARETLSTHAHVTA